jgi:hypothetical protein
MRLWVLMLEAREGVWLDPVLDGMLCTEAMELSTEGR